jgi:hypothetical protein
LPPVTNVGLIGDYGGIVVNSRIGGKIRGVLDIVGSAPLDLSNDSKNGYLNLWNVSVNMGANRFYIVSIKDLNGTQYVNKRGFGSPEPANVIIHPKKYTPTDIDNTALGLTPSYRAFLDGSTPKITPITGAPAIAAAYKGSETAGTTQVPPLDEASWINAANSNNGAAPTFQSYASAPKWVNATFDALPIIAAAPEQSDIRFAGMSGKRLEAVLPSRSKSSFEEAFSEAS